MTDSEKIARQVHEMWPFIPEEDIKTYCISLTGAQAAEAAVRISLWVLDRVLKHHGLPPTARPEAM